MNWNVVLSNKTADVKVQSLNDILLNVLKNFVPQKIIKLDSKYPKWMNLKFVSYLRNKFKLTKRHYSNPIKENQNLVTAKSNECSNRLKPKKVTRVN